jgi:hypothetical protein
MEEILPYVRRIQVAVPGEFGEVHIINKFSTPGGFGLILLAESIHLPHVVEVDSKVP